MAADEQTTTLPVAEWTYRSDADRRRVVDALLCDSRWSLLSDEAIASSAEANPDLVRDCWRAMGSAAPLSAYGEGGLPWRK